MRRNKVICKCYNITVDKIIKSVENGNIDWKDLKKDIKISTDCKHCKEHAKLVFKDVIDGFV